MSYEEEAGPKTMVEAVALVEASDPARCTYGVLAAPAVEKAGERPWVSFLLSKAQVLRGLRQFAPERETKGCFVVYDEHRRLTHFFVG